MERTNLPFFYRFGYHLHPITMMQPEQIDRFQLLFLIWSAKGYLRGLIDWGLKLTVCLTPWRAFAEAVESYEKMYNTLSPEQLQKSPVHPEYGEIQKVISSAKEFETVLCAELNTLAVYGITQKGIYSTADLIERAENIFPASALKKLDPEVMEEIRQSGRCLAFDVATASAFHMMRATESVMHQYYLHVCKPTSKKKLDNWGAYIAKLEQLQDTGVKEVVAMLKQIKNRHRNLIMHPEIVLTPDEAFTLFLIAQGAIIAMADKL